MKACLVICLLALLPHAYFRKHCLRRELFNTTGRILEDKQNTWELGNEFEGDILEHGRRNVRSNESLRWSSNTVPYEFDSFYDKEQRQWIVDALQEITNSSCINIRLRTKTDKDYIFITEKKEGCNSYVGRIGGRQTLHLKRAPLGRGCFNKGVIVHEFMHALGFFHQHSVHNRDKYIKIYYENIRKGKERDFNVKMKDASSSLGEPYDYKSIMHYSSYAKSDKGKMTIEPKNSRITLTKNRKLSEIDIRKLNKLYPCSKKGNNVRNVGL